MYHTAIQMSHRIYIYNQDRTSVDVNIIYFNYKLAICTKSLTTITRNWYIKKENYTNWI